MRSVLICRAVTVALAFAVPFLSAGSEKNCAVTKQPNRLFFPPAGYDQYQITGAFWYGNDSLWTIIHPHRWRAGGNDGAKLPFWRRGFDWKSVDKLRLAVVARRVDAFAPLVWADGISSTSIDGSNAPGRMAMLTGIDIPIAGCWEISAHYLDQTLAYTIWVEP
jgi:hypothetical protein